MTSAVLKDSSPKRDAMVHRQKGLLIRLRAAGVDTWENQSKREPITQQRPFLLCGAFLCLIPICADKDHVGGSYGEAGLIGVRQSAVPASASVVPETANCGLVSCF
jgi:hypothetical protein